MKNPLRVGIIGPCPPPHGGVTRIIGNHLYFWKGSPIETWLIPAVVPDKPAVYEGTTLVDHRRAKRTLGGAIGALFLLPARMSPMRLSQYRDMMSLDTAVANVIREQRLDVLYAHHSTITGAVAVDQARRAGIPAVVVAYGETWLVSEQDMRRKRMIEHTVRHADWVVSTSEHCRRGAITRGADAHRSSVIYAGIDLERFRPGLDGSGFRAKLGIPDSAVVVSVLGLALRRKLDTLLDALAPLLATEPSLHVLIGGTGDEAQYVTQRVDAIGSGRVKALGFVPEQELAEFYSATDILVVSQRTMIECMGQSMKEAMSCGRTVVGSNIGGVPEAIEDGRSGLLFKADDPADLVRALRELIHDPARRQAMGVRGRAIAEEKFDASVAARQTLDLLSRVSGRAS